MANLQRYFEQFHDAIRADYEMNDQLREKRDIIMDLLKRRLKEAERPSCSQLLQGSYKFGTGIYPIEKLEYDIDVGMVFCFSETDHSAKEARSWVYDAVAGHTDNVEEKGPCIRVSYVPNYHVDLVTYCTWKDAAGQDQYRLGHDTKGWRPAEPTKMVDIFRNARRSFEGTEDGTETDQLRRVVRYLKRWNDEAIPFEAEYKLSGLALLLLAMRSLTPTKSWDGSVDDLSALHGVAAAANVSDTRLVIQKQTQEFEDLAGRVSDDEMSKLKARFRALATACASAKAEVDPVKACETMRAVLGRDFPVPKREDVTKKTSGPAIVTSSASA